MMDIYNLKVKRIHPDAKIPAYASDEASGMDVCSVEDVTINPLERKLVKTGLIFDIPKGHEIQVRPRSGLAAKYGITVLNTPGTIDSDYRGEVKIILYNSDKDNPYQIKVGDRIAQLVSGKVERANVEETTGELSETQRGSGGFGSTGA
jgi:dUTP pyrophosphatase